MTIYSTPPVTSYSTVCRSTTTAPTLKIAGNKRLIGIKTNWRASGRWRPRLPLRRTHKPFHGSSSPHLPPSSLIEPLPIYSAHDALKQRTRVQPHYLMPSHRMDTPSSSIYSILVLYNLSYYNFFGFSSLKHDLPVYNVCVLILKSVRSCDHDHVLKMYINPMYDRLMTRNSLLR